MSRSKSTPIRKALIFRADELDPSRFSDEIDWDHVVGKDRKLWFQLDESNDFDSDVHLSDLFWELTTKKIKTMTAEEIKDILDKIKRYRGCNWCKGRRWFYHDNGEMYAGAFTIKREEK